MDPSYILYHIIGGKLSALPEILLIVIGVLYMYGPKIYNFIKTYYYKEKDTYFMEVPSKELQYIYISEYLLFNNYYNKCRYTNGNLRAYTNGYNTIKVTDSISVEFYKTITTHEGKQSESDALKIISTISIADVIKFKIMCENFATSKYIDKLYLIDYNGLDFDQSILDYINDPVNHQTFDNIKYSEHKDMLIKEIEYLKNIDNYCDGKRRKITLMFSGKPGTGKTYHVQAMALYAKKHLVTINMKNVNTYADITKIFDYYIRTRSAEVKRKDCILFFDELDKFIENYKPNNKMVNTPHELLSMLLTKLDGVGLYEGDIFIAAANDISKFHPSLLRNGRFKVIEFKYLTKHQLQEYGKELFGTCPDINEKYNDKFSQSEIFNTKYDDIEDYLTKLQELFNEKTK